MGWLTGLSVHRDTPDGQPLVADEKSRHVRVAETWLKTPRRRLVASVAAGLMIGVAATTGGYVGLLFATAIGIVVVVNAAADIADNSTSFGRIALLFAIADVILIHRSPSITLIEIILFVPGVVVLLRSRSSLIALTRAEPVMRVFVLSAAGILILCLLYSIWQPSGLALGVSQKEFGKNLEIVFGMLAIVAWVDSRERFMDLYALVTTAAFVATVQPAFALGGHVFSTDSLQTEAPIVFLLLALPFLRNPSVALLAGVASVVLVVARTRGSWIIVVAFALFALGLGRFRRFLGRSLVVAVAVGTCVMLVAVLAVGPVRSRFELLVAGHDQSIRTRLSMLHAAELEAQHFPLTGVGPGHFKRWLVANGSPVHFRIGLVKIPSDPHNTFAKFLAELGLPGFCLFILLIGSIAVVPWLVWRKRSWGGAIELAPYMVGVAFYAPIYVLLRFISEWSALARVDVILGGGMFLALLRLTKPVRPTSAEL